MLADGNGEFTRAMGLEVDMSGAGLGIRSQRYAAVIDDGVVTALLRRARTRAERELGRVGAGRAVGPAHASGPAGPAGPTRAPVRVRSGCG